MRSFRRTIRRSINRSLQKYKHVTDNSAANVNMQAVVTAVILMVGLDNPVIGNPTNVQARARVSALYFELSFQNTSAVNIPQTLHWCLQYNPQGVMPTVDPSVVGTSTAKNYVFKQGHMTVFGSNQPTKVYGLVRIPRKYQRFMNTDLIQMNLRTQYNQGLTDTYQLKTIYKEIRG